MNDNNHDFTRIIDERRAAVAREHEARQLILREEEERRRLNLQLVESTLADIVLPLFREAAAAVAACGGYSRVESTHVETTRQSRIVLVAALCAHGELAVNTTQAHCRLSYEGDPATLSFGITNNGTQRAAAPIVAITEENVAVEITSLLRQI